MSTREIKTIWIMAGTFLIGWLFGTWLGGVIRTLLGG